MLFGKIATFCFRCGVNLVSEGISSAKGCRILIGIQSSLLKLLCQGKVARFFLWGLNQGLSEGIFPGKGCHIIIFGFHPVALSRTSIVVAVLQGQLTGLLGNLSLLSYFAGKKERGAMVVQAVGVVSTLVVLSQLALAGAMPVPAFAVTASAVAVGLLLNFLSYNNMLAPALWSLWGDVVTVGGLTVLPQVCHSFFFFTGSSVSDSRRQLT